MKPIRLMARRARLLAVAATVAMLTFGTGAAVNAAPSGAAAGACAPGTDVTTASGPICGITQGSVSEWLGIPYAAPPVGSLRWEPPQPPTPWTSTLAATQFGNSCQTGRPGAVSSEDCLYLNVWRPAGGSNLPVMVHIHGGGFFGGNGNDDNTLLANTGHEVIVSMNYRLGIFGFLANPVLGPHSGDYGLQDQQAALRWVQANIARFGGDPDNVTIFGESAGGSSVCDQIASPTAKGLFEHAISTSGEYNTLLGVPEQAPRSPEDLEAQDCKSALPSQAQADSIGSKFAAAVGCGPGTSDVAACLRALPVDVVQKAAYTPGDGYEYGGQGTVAPTINGSTLTMSLRQALARGKVNRVDVIAGTDRDENLVGVANTAADYVSLVNAQYGKYASQVLKLYPLARFGSPYIAWRTVAADSDTVCSSIFTDQALARRMPVYGYLITDSDLPPYTQTSPTGASHVGAWFLNPVSPHLDANQQVLQDQELAYVTSFARTGTPDAQGTPVWPEFNRADAEIELAPAGDSQVMPISQISAIHNCGFWSKIAPRP
jgi:para-nitrobenzyl esterase